MKITFICHARSSPELHLQLKDAPRDAIKRLLFGLEVNNEGWGGGGRLGQGGAETVIRSKSQESNPSGVGASCSISSDEQKHSGGQIKKKKKSYYRAGQTFRMNNEAYLRANSHSSFQEYSLRGDWTTQFGASSLRLSSRSLVSKYI